MMQPLILCLGNEIISDDGFGPYVAELLQADDRLNGKAEVISACTAGFGLIDILAGRDRVLIVDIIRTGNVPAGAVHQFPAGQLAPSRYLTTSHQINLPTALELGRQMGVIMPKSVDVIAVEGEDMETLRVGLTPAVQNAVAPTIELIHKWVTDSSW